MIRYYSRNVCLHVNATAAASRVMGPIRAAGFASKYCRPSLCTHPEMLHAFRHRPKCNQMRRRDTLLHRRALIVLIASEFISSLPRIEIHILTGLLLKHTKYERRHSFKKIWLLWIFFIHRWIYQSLDPTVNAVAALSRNFLAWSTPEHLVVSINDKIVLSFFRHDFPNQLKRSFHACNTRRTWFKNFNNYCVHAGMLFIVRSILSI